jgi:hypothetical protein
MSGNQPVIIYISAASDLIAEREALARMIAELPVTLPWRIVHSPTAAGPIDAEALINANLYFLVMGSDIRAPVGLELHTAGRAGKTPFAFAKRGVGYTPAGEIFVKENRSKLNWRSFTNPAQLNRQVQRFVIQHLLQRAITYVLTPAEIADLEQLLRRGTGGDQPIEAEGAGHSAVILSRERYLPSEGTLIEE